MRIEDPNIEQRLLENGMEVMSILFKFKYALMLGGDLGYPEYERVKKVCEAIWGDIGKEVK